METNLYNFTDDAGSFRFPSARNIKSLYLPLCNEFLMSSVTPELRGDIKNGQHHFLLEPVSRIDLFLSRSSRNFWVFLGKGKVWSAAGVSGGKIRPEEDKFMLEAGLLWQKVTRENTRLGLKSEILSFVPAGTDALEVMRVTIVNTGRKTVKFTPCAAVPLYARSADNLRDHRHVTSLLTRIRQEKYGVKIKPTLLFNEAGHHPNKTVYYFAACDGRMSGPRYIYPTQDFFYGSGGNPEIPEAVFEDKLPPEGDFQGREPMGGLRFRRISLKPGGKAVYTVIMGISPVDPDLRSLLFRYSRPAGLNRSFERTARAWQDYSKSIETESGDKNFDNWLRWVSIQPLLRKIYGCSFLPDFDYGKGGRGWRDLWQDCLGLILNDPRQVRPLLVNNFCGVKIDGSNATIIGKNPGEFIADRNNISRVWMDHGVWPLITLDLYLNETADFSILAAPATYFRNHQVDRAGRIDYRWNPGYGNRLKSRSGKIYSGTVLEHLLVQNLVQFYNVGAHNHVRLEGADWNDGLDMAGENGESAAFSSMYAQNLLTLSQLPARAGIRKIEVAAELGDLFIEFDYADAARKRRILAKYFSLTRECISGKKISLDAEKLSVSLKRKALWMKQHIRNSEWLKEGFFNGYYDNRKKRVDGRKGKRIQMTLASQVFPIMSGVANAAQTEKIISNIRRYLYDHSTGGIRLNTDFKKEQHDLGRAFSFSYGDKENGAVFSHMVVMLSYALYQRGYSHSAWETLSSLYKLASNSAKSRIYPCLPEYFDREGRGMYSYLTGSASWFMLTLLTRAFGVRGQDGDLLIEPRFSAEQFRSAPRIGITRVFAGRRLKLLFSNTRRLGDDEYTIRGLKINKEEIPLEEGARIIISREVIEELPKDKLNVIEVSLG